MSIITKNHKAGLFAIFIASALMLGTISVSGFDNALATVYKQIHKNDYKGKSNENKRSNTNGASQSIDQTQVSKQSSECRDSGAVVTVSALNCNNVGLQLNLNTGSNA
ncbi:MAG: hypothetical protein WKF36_00625 [Candidatus Nitrosocosmicus sp.]